MTPLALCLAFAAITLSGWLAALAFWRRAQRLAWSLGIAKRAADRSVRLVEWLRLATGAANNETTAETVERVLAHLDGASADLDAALLTVESQRLALDALRGSLADVHVAMRAWWDAHDRRVEDTLCRRALAILEGASGTTIPAESAAVLTERAAGKVALDALRASADKDRRSLAGVATFDRERAIGEAFPDSLVVTPGAPAAWGNTISPGQLRVRVLDVVYAALAAAREAEPPEPEPPEPTLDELRAKVASLRDGVAITAEGQRMIDEWIAETEAEVARREARS